MGTTAQVLVVDDDPGIRMLCRINLEVDGYGVREAGTLDDARAELAAAPPDLVLLDVHVAGRDGLELLEEIRREHAGMAVALLTGSADLASGEAASADAVVPKPFTLDLLLGTVARLAETHR